MAGLTPKALPPGFRIERLTPRHASDYRALMVEAYERHPSAFTTHADERRDLPLAWWEARLSEAVDAKEVVFGALRDDGALCGVAGLLFETRVKARHKATLFGMVVVEGCRGLGLGRALVRATQDFAIASGYIRVVQLTVSEGNDGAEALYAACGFVRFGVEPMAIVLAGQFIAKVHMSWAVGFAESSFDVKWLSLSR